MKRVPIHAIVPDTGQIALLLAIVRSDGTVSAVDMLQGLGEWSTMTGEEIIQRLLVPAVAQLQSLPSVGDTGGRSDA